jgi:CheY-like chemotaxis protein
MTDNNHVIFIVDDDSYYRKLISAIVRRICERDSINARVLSYANGEECLENLRLRPSLIILDFFLDTRNDITATAYDLLDDIHKNVADTFILLISGQEDWSLFKEDLIASGASDFIHKGRNLESDLENIIRRTLM